MNGRCQLGPRVSSWRRSSSRDHFGQHRLNGSRGLLPREEPGASQPPLTELAGQPLVGEQAGDGGGEGTGVQGIHQERRIAHVATDNRPTVQMLARRASRTKRLELHDADALGDLTPERASFLEHVDAVIRDITHAEKGWQRDPVARGLTKGFIEGLGKLIPLPSIDLQPGDLAALRDEFGDLPYVFYRRHVSNALGTSKTIVSIRPEFDAGQEGKALWYRRTLEPRERAS